MNKIIMHNKNSIEASLLSNDEITKNTYYTLPNRSGTLPIIVPELKDEECIEVTVGPNGDFKELHDAVQEMSKFTVLHSEARHDIIPRKVIKVLPNYTMEKPLWCIGNNYGDIFIQAEENEVLINREAIITNNAGLYVYNSSILMYNTISPIFSGKFTMMENRNMNLKEVHLFYAFCSRLTIKHSSTLTGGFYGIFATGSSCVNADHCKFIANNTTLQLIRAHGSMVDCNRTTFDVSSVNGDELYQTGIGGRKDFASIFTSEGGFIRAFCAIFIGNNYNGSIVPLAYSAHGSIICVVNGTFSNNGYGLRVTSGGILVANSAVFDNIITETNIPINTIDKQGLIIK